VKVHTRLRFTYLVGERVLPADGAISTGVGASMYFDCKGDPVAATDGYLNFLYLSDKSADEDDTRASKRHDTRMNIVV
jgi:hypothetical protein